MPNKFCTECGSKNHYTNSKPKFCSECGHRFEGEATASQSSQEDFEGTGGVEIESPFTVIISGKQKKQTIGQVASNVDPKDIEYNHPSKVDPKQVMDAWRTAASSRARRNTNEG